MITCKAERVGVATILEKFIFLREKYGVRPSDTAPGDSNHTNSTAYLRAYASLSARL